MTGLRQQRRGRRFPVALVGGPDAPVVIVDLARGYGGAEARVVTVARDVSRRRPLTVVCLEGSPLHVAVSAAGLHAVPVRHRRGDPRMVAALRRVFVEERARVVDAHNVQSQLWALIATWLTPGVTLVATVHSHYLHENQGRRRARWYELVLRLLAGTGAGFIAVSDSVRDYLAAVGAADARTAVVWNAVDPPRAPHADRAVVRRSLGLAEDDFVVATIARLVAVKGHRVLLDALGPLVGHVPQVRWLVVGDGPEGPGLAALAEGAHLAPHVRWLGFRDDVATLLAASDCFALPSLSEGLPLALLEAVGLGLPIVATSVGAVPDVVSHGRSARLVPAGDAAALTRELRWVAEHPVAARAMARQAAVSAADRLDVGTMVEHTLRAYEGLVAT